MKIFSPIAGIAVLGLLVGCGGSDDNSLPPINGFNSSDEVAASNLVAYWPLNGNGKEMVSNTNPSNTSNVTFVPGAKGQAANFSEGYLAYPEIAALSSTTGSITISLWAKVNNNGGPNGHPSVFFSLTRPNEWAGNVNFFAETGWQPSTSDSLTIKGLVVIKNPDNSPNFQDNINRIKAPAADIAAGHTPFPNKVAGTWAHFVMVWDGANGKLLLYANGTKISNVPWEVRNGGNPLNLNYFTPTRAVLGAFWTVPFGTPDPWQRGLTGQLDEVRVYNRVLTPAEIFALYSLEGQGR